MEAYNNRGIVYIHKGDCDKAVADETQTIRLDPKHATAYLSRGLAYKDKDDWDKAIADYTDAILFKSD